MSRIVKCDFEYDGYKGLPQSFVFEKLKKEIFNDTFKNICFNIELDNEKVRVELDLYNDYMLEIDIVQKIYFNNETCHNMALFTIFLDKQSIKLYHHTNLIDLESFLGIYYHVFDIIFKQELLEKELKDNVEVKQNVKPFKI